jgi:uridine phosphorylase
MSINFHHPRELQIFSENSNRAVFVRDLPYSCSTNDLRSLLKSQANDIEIERAVVFTNSKGRGLQYGCILLKNPEDIPQIISRLDNQRLIGRNIR